MPVDLDSLIDRLTAGAQQWAAWSYDQRATLLRATHRTIAHHAKDWVVAAVSAKGGPDRWLVGEEWLSGPYPVLESITGLADSLDALARNTSPAAALRAGRAPGNRVTLQVLPTNPKENVLLGGYRAQVWLRPGVELTQALAGAGLGAQRPSVGGGVAVVLGAGNVSAIGPLDVLSQLVADNRASVLKVNPTFDRLVSVYQRALAPLIEADLLEIMSGDAELGERLVHHRQVAHVHLTGSRRTHDAIVWGTHRRRHTTGVPAITASVTSELGGVSPCIVVPGLWSRAQLRWQAEQVVTQRLNNAGHNCIGTQVMILSSDWAQRREFLDAIREVLAGLPHRKPWYPGGAASLAHLARRHPHAEQHAGCYLIEVDPRRSDDLFDSEFFGPALAHTSLPGTGSAYLRNAVAFANDRLDGTLGAGIIASPQSRKAMGPGFAEVIAELRYGAIGINVWAGFIFDLAGAPWGGFPGGTLTEPSSGVGVVHNAYLLSETERTVAEGPFRPFPRPPWFVTARNTAATGERMTQFATNPTWGRLLRVVPAALRG